MDRTYYFKNLLISLALLAISIFTWFHNNTSSRQENLYFLLIMITSTVLFPFSKRLIERFFLSFTSPAFWTRGLLIENPGKNGLYAIFWILCIASAIPLGGAYLIYLTIYKSPALSKTGRKDD
jgi:uncharacterized membrane protein